MADNKLYVSENLGNDATGDGSSKKPYKSVLQVCFTCCSYIFVGSTFFNFRLL